MGGVPDRCTRCNQVPEEWWLRVLVPPEEINKAFSSPMFEKLAEKILMKEKEAERIKYLKSKYVQVYNQVTGMWALIDRGVGRIIGQSEEMYEYVPVYDGKE